MIERKFFIRGGTEQLAKKMMGAEKLVIICPQYVYPDSHQIRSSDVNNSFSIDTQALFEVLEISKENLKEVYEFKKEIGLFIGNFTKNGKQNLANLLGKTLEIYPQLISKPISGSDFKEVFQPQKAKK
ncbi:hypothetical protein COY29_03580 [Candidatus Woesebacteria bacterium CG_4_10_14_0_2_um_filter_39_14]|uniref:Uncharacterized protein n=3 Tax=Microgenomates group TaxID=1794810 RepID=A0A2M6YPY9_9BACT|nr:MAG: hypothetical protein COT04_01235 [Candidatus Shapirobacteria bacterium CG07_land_8_20_14_0_80_39_12]PIZ48538.1 MAG: hypothetical protein COY29_03580 [Candidatus Woesebacteria bacterium CG_4_10_14_0_2_um_filter_39_14]PJA49815.1 MAG: hypothetical protein CO169_00860 [Candidatus Shapirobacteria bacterium CG_4_9_14_3_um_filter_39_13]